MPLPLAKSDGKALLVCWPDQPLRDVALHLENEQLAGLFAQYLNMAIADAVAAEREACARLALELGERRLAVLNARMDAVPPGGARCDNLAGVAAMGAAEKIATAIRDRR